MIKNNKGKAIISSLIILLPILIGLILWNDLPNTMATHWGADASADGFSSKAVAVFALPVILLVLQWVCLLLTSLDKKQKNQNKKALSMVFWIIPVLSLFSSSMIYSAALGKEFKFEIFTPALFGLMFIVMGNYLPKIRQNRTLGIKLSWTINNEENWNKTHRLGGKVWVICGLILLFSIFLPVKFMIPVMCLVIIAAVVIPTVYSYTIYRRHKKEGIDYFSAPKSKSEKTISIITAIFVPVLIIGITIGMFTGNININFKEDSFVIEASYWSDPEIEYSSIYSVTYREDVDAGMRTNGFGSARLSMGTFSNEEFGTYTRYSYTTCPASVVLDVDGNILVISGKDKEETKEIYNTLILKTENR